MCFKMLNFIEMACLNNRSWLLQATFHLLLWMGAAIFIFRFIRILAPPGAAFEIITMRIGIFMALFYTHTEFLIPRFFHPRRYLYYGLSLATLLLAATALRVAYERAFLLEILRQVPIYDDDIQIGVTFGSMVTIALIGLVYKLWQRQMQRERDNQALIAEQREAEVQLLRAQLNPHFLFNMLNNIYSLSITQSPKAPELVLKLSELLRYVTYDSRENRVLLSQEVHYIRIFIDIFQLKSHAPLPLKFEVEGDLGMQKTEPLLLLPLVENAFKHCDFEAEGAFLHIHLAVEERGFKFSTENSKAEMVMENEKQGGVGLENIRKRLALRSDDKFSLDVNNQARQFTVTLYSHA